MRSWKSGFRIFVIAGMLGAGVASVSLQARERDRMGPIPLQQTENIRVVYQINQDEWKNDVGKGLLYLRKLLQTYEEQKVPQKNIDVHGVFHGEAGYWMLNDQAYQTFTKKEQGNPNREIVRQLAQAGVSLELCANTMKEQGWKAEDLLPEVKMVVGAYPRVIDLQLQGYAYIRF